ncbi:MAG: nucleoside hydrolase [Pseudomonadota bacterium]
MTRLIIDTDVALGVWHEGRPRDIDDGFAIVEAINSSKIDLLGVTCVFGNGPQDEVYRVAGELVNLKQATVPVHRGAAVAMAKDSATNPAVTFLAEQLARQPLTIAAIGPLTNIGLLIKHYPEVLGNIEQLIMVAGRTPGREFYIGEAGPVQDFNFENDVDAAELVMQAGIPCVLMGFELTSQVCVTAGDLQTIKQRANPTAGYFYDNSIAWCDYWTQTFPVDDGFHPWDSAAIAWLLNPGWFASEARGHQVNREPDQLNCATTLSGPQHTYCYGFQPGGAEAFVQQVIAEVY